MQSQHDIHEVLSILRKLQDPMGPTAMKLTAAVTLHNPNTWGALAAFPSQNVRVVVFWVTGPTLMVLWSRSAFSWCILSSYASLTRRWWCSGDVVLSASACSLIYCFPDADDTLRPRVCRRIWVQPHQGDRERQYHLLIWRRLNGWSESFSGEPEVFKLKVLWNTRQTLCCTSCIIILSEPPDFPSRERSRFRHL